MKHIEFSHKALAILLCGSVLHFCSIATIAGELGATWPVEAARDQALSSISTPSAGSLPGSLRSPLMPRFIWRNGRLVTTNPALALHAPGIVAPKIGYASAGAVEPAAGFPFTFDAPPSIPPAQADTAKTSGGQKMMALFILGGLAALSIALVVHASNQDDPKLGARAPTRVIP